MQDLRNKRTLILFLAIGSLVLTQVAWWATLFVREVSTVAMLKKQNLELSEKQGTVAPEEAAVKRAGIDNEAFHRRVMFLSESVFFAFLAPVGLYLLFHALRVEAKSRETQRNFIETVTHESKTPMTALKLRLESVEAKWRSDAALGREIGLALDEVRRLISIFEKAMSLNRVEREAFTFETLSLPELVQDVVRRLDPFLRARNVTVTVEAPADILVKGDAHGLAMCVQSVLENAAIYNDNANKRVLVTLKEEYSVAVIVIADNGPGIAAEDRPRIFERFYRAQAGRRVPGTGLGLYLAKTIVDAHGGVIRLAENGTPGATFEIELPAVKA